MKAVQKKLNAKSIFPRRYFYPSLDELPYIKSENCAVVSRDVASRILCLPLYPELKLDLINEICQTILNEHVKATSTAIG